LSKEAALTESDAQELLQQTSIAALKLKQQVENLLNISRLESGYLQLQKNGAMSGN